MPKPPYLLQYSVLISFHVMYHPSCNMLLLSLLTLASLRPAPVVDVCVAIKPDWFTALRWSLLGQKEDSATRRISQSTACETAVNFSDFPVTNLMVPIALLPQVNLDIYQKYEEIMLRRPEKVFALQARGMRKHSSYSGPCGHQEAPGWVSCCLLSSLKCWSHFNFMWLYRQTFNKKANSWTDSNVCQVHLIPVCAWVWRLILELGSNMLDKMTSTQGFTWSSHTSPYLHQEMKLPWRCVNKKGNKYGRQ